MQRAVPENSPPWIRRALLGFAFAAPILTLYLGRTHLLIALAPLFVSHLLLLYATLVPNCQWWGPVIRSFATTQPEVWITIDDGPSPAHTTKILDLLERFDARATFFVIGFLADAYPDIVLREHRAGMAVGNHTYNHPEVPPFGQLPRRLLDAEIALGAKSLARIGIVPRLLRPPAGSTSARVERAAEAAGERIVLWSVDPVDWRTGVTAAQIKRRVLSAVEPGSIVILHDGGGDQSATVAALPGIIKGIRRKGLRLVPLSPT